MKIELLKEFIKKTVQQEVRNVIQEELKIQLTEIFSKQISQPKKKSSDNLEHQILKELETMNESVISEEPKSVKKYVKYTNNSILNDILNETTNKIKPESDFVGMLGDGFASQNRESLNEVKSPENAPEPVKTVFNAMNKDYRALMKAVDKKRRVNIT